MEVTREELVEAFKLWTERFEKEGNTTELVAGTVEYDEGCADYLIELVEEIKNK